MNFYDLIAKYKYKCSQKLEVNRNESNQITAEINKTREYIGVLNSKYHISPYIAGCTGVSLLFCAMFAFVFESLIWISLAVGGALLSGVGVYQEKEQENFQKYKKKWYKYYTDLNGDLNELRLEEIHLKSLLNDVTTCCNYYMYLVDEVIKQQPIDIDLDAVYESKCLLSTYLDKFYSGELEDFQKLSLSQKKAIEKTNRIQERINDKRYPNGQEPQLSIHRRRRQGRISEEPEEQKVLQFPTNLKRRA